MAQEYTMRKAQHILSMADTLIHGERQEDYGPPYQSFRRIARAWSAYRNEEFTEQDVAMMMILLKCCRVRGKPTEDTLIDIAGYAALAAEAGVLDE